MKDPDYTADELALADTAGRWLSFVGNEYLNEQEQSESGFDSQRWKEMVDLGWTSIALPESVGGAGGSLADVGVVLRECGYAAYASPLLPTVRAATFLDLVGRGPDSDNAFGSTLRAIAGGARATLISPPDGGLIAERSPDGFRLVGDPVTVDWADQADETVVVAPLHDSDEVLVAVRSRGASGCTIEPVGSMDNERHARVSLRGVEVGDDDHCRVVSGAVVRQALARADLLRASAMVGGCAAVLDMSARYALERHQFGQPIGGFQAVRHHLARMSMATDAARLTTNEALTLDPASPARPVSMDAVALFVSGRSYVQVVLTAAQVHGGIGTTVEHVLHHHYRRAKAMQLRSGRRANRLREIHRSLVVAGEGGLW